MDGKGLKTKYQLKTLLAMIGLLGGLVGPIQAQDEDVYFAVYPIQATVSYGANDKVYNLKFKLTNNDKTDPNSPKSLSGFALSSSLGSTFPITILADKSCPSITLPPRGQGESCVFHVQFRASGNSLGGPTDKPNETLSLTLQTSSKGKSKTITSPSFPLIYATGNHAPALSRHISAKNNCDFPVWVGIAPYPAKSINPDPEVYPNDPYSCKSTRDCYPGSTCINVNKVLKRCFWEPTRPLKDKYLIKPYSQTSMNIPFFDNGIETIWEGALAARTECEGGSCITAECGSTIKGKSGVACAPGKHFAVPSSHAKLNLQAHQTVIYNTTPNGNAAHDAYSVSLAQGINVPLSIEPQFATWGGSSQPYHCGIAGGRYNTYPLGGCSWDFSPPNNDYLWVTHEPHASQCKTNSDCKKPYECGLSFNPTALSGKQITKNCGKKLGYWTPLALCTKDPQFASSLLDCRSLTYEGNSLGDLYACTKGDLRHSCYKNEATSSCCGCVNWDSVPGVKVPGAPLTKSCQNENPNWSIHAQSKLTWLKSACPTASVYPQDHASGEFHCQTLNTQLVNTAHYTVVFCP